MRPVKRIPIWEKAKRKNRKKKIIRIVLLILIFFAVVNIVIKIPGLVRDLNEPFDRLDGDKKTEKEIDYSFRTNFLLISMNEKNKIGDAAILSIEPVDQKISILHLDFEKNLFLQKEARGVFKEGGVEKLQKYISSNLTIPVDRYLTFNNLEISARQTSEVKGEVESPIIFLKGFGAKGDLEKNGLKTNLSSRELLDLFWKLRSGSFVEGSFFSIETAKSLADPKIQTAIKNQFLDNKILDEGATVAVVNSSGESGLASVLTNYLVSLGASVVDVESGTKAVEETFLYVKKDKPAIEERLSKIIEFEKKSDKKEFSGDILIILGESAVQDLTVR